MFQKTEEEKIYVHEIRQKNIFFTAQDAYEESLTLEQSFQKQGRLYLFFQDEAVEPEKIKSRMMHFRSISSEEGILLIPKNSENIYNWVFIPMHGDEGRKELIFGNIRLEIPAQGNQEWRIAIKEDNFVFQKKEQTELTAEMKWEAGFSLCLSHLSLVMNGEKSGCLTFDVQNPGSLKNMGVSLRYAVKKEEKEENDALGPDAYDMVCIYPMEYVDEIEGESMKGYLDLCDGLWKSRSLFYWDSEVSFISAFRRLPTGQLHLTAPKILEEKGKNELPCLIWEKERRRKCPVSEEYYLAPCGDFRVQESGRVLPGLCGLEYIKVESGDILRFCPYQEGEAEAGKLVEQSDTTVPYLTVLDGKEKVPCYYTQPQVRPLFELENKDILSYCEVPFVPMDKNVSVPVFPAAGLEAGSVEKGVALENNTLYLQRFKTMEEIAKQLAEKQFPEKGKEGKAEEQFAEKRNEKRAGDWVIGKDAAADRIRAVTEQGIMVEYTQESLAADSFERVEFAEGFVLKGVSGKLKASLLSEKCFAVISDAEEFRKCCREEEMKLTVDSWGFDFISETWETYETVIVLKYTRDFTIRELTGLREQWSYTTSQAADRLQKKIDRLFDIQKEIPQFDKLREIVQDREWCGVLVFNAAMTPGQMPAGLAFLSQGMSAEDMEAHHLIMRARTLLPENMFLETEKERKKNFKDACLSPTLVDGLIYYVSGLEFGDRCKDYAFVVTRLVVVFEASLTREFSCEIGLLVNRLFLTLTKPSEDAENSMIMMEGRYQEQDGIGTYLFDLKENTHLALLSSPITEVNFTRAQVLVGGNNVDCAVDFLFDGALYFEEKSGQTDQGLDLYSYGQENGGLDFTGLCIHMEHQSFEVRNQQMVFRSNTSQPREDSFASQIPMEPGWVEVHDQDGVMPSTLGYVGISVDGMEQTELTERWSGIIWEISLGGMGLLAESLAPRFLVLTAFSPDDSIFRSNAMRQREDAPTRRYVGAKLVFGKKGGSQTGFSLTMQQFIQLNFGSLELKKREEKDGKQGNCGILIRDFRLKALDISMPPGGNSIWIFGMPGTKDLAWFAEYTEK